MTVKVSANSGKSREKSIFCLAERHREKTQLQKTLLESVNLRKLKAARAGGDGR